MLTKQQRIDLSTKIVNIPEEIAALTATESTIVSGQAKLLEVDNFNKLTTDRLNSKIKSYQDEHRIISGTDFTETTETDIQNAGKKLKGNFFFPNEQSVPLPSIPDGVWKNYPPFYMSYGLGKSKLEVYGQTANWEQKAISDAIANIDTLLGIAQQNTVSGNKCIDNVDPTPDQIVPDSDVTTNMNSLISRIGEIIAFNNQIVSVINANTDLTSENTTSKNNAISNAATMQAWLDLPTYSNIPAFTCPVFNSYNVSLLPTSKGFHSVLNDLKTSLNSRSSYLTTRISQLNTVLGFVSVDSKGAITTSSGLFGDRAKALNVRLNSIGGSLVEYLNSSVSLDAVDQQKKLANDLSSFYKQSLSVSVFTAHANGTPFLFLDTASGLNVGQKAYIYAEGQEEIQVVIKSIQGNTVTVEPAISPKYKTTNKARLYVDKT